MATCHCLGPQNGQPLCPCQMAAAEGYLTAHGPYTRVTISAGTTSMNPTRKLLYELPEVASEICNPEDCKAWLRKNYQTIRTALAVADDQSTAVDAK